MKYMNKIVSGLIMLQLSLMNLPLGFSGVAYAGENDCPEGQEPDPNRNGFCVMTDNVIELKIESGQCEGLTGANYEQCFKNAADTAVDDAEFDQKNEKGIQKEADKNYLKFGMPMIASFAAGWILLKKAPALSSCPSTSMWLLLGGAIAGMGSEIAAQLSYKNEIDNIQERYSERVKSSQDGDSASGAFNKSTEAQTAALKALADQEQARINVEGVRQTGYTIASGLYAAAVVAATVEAISQSGGASCYSEDGSSAASEAPASAYIGSPFLQDQVPGLLIMNRLSPSEFGILLISKIVNNLGLTSAHASDKDEKGYGGVASGGGALAGIAGVLLTPAGSGMESFVSKALGSGVVRGALAGVLGGYSYVLRDQAKRIKENSEKKKAAIEEIIVSYEDTGGSAWQDCTEEQRDNPGVPACYCFNADGTPNQQRKMRQTCFSISSGGPMAASKYSGSNGGGYVPVKACLKSDGQIDEGCQVCKKKPNACPTMAKANMGNLSLMKGLGVSSMVDDANNLATGNLSHSDLNVGDLEKKAANIEKATARLAKDPKTKSVLEKMNGIEDKWKKAEQGLMKKSMQQNPNLLASLGMPSMAPTTEKEDLIKEAKEKIATKSKPRMAKKAGGKQAKKKSASEFDFDFGDGAGGVEISKDEIMDKEFKVTGDIHKNSNTNLFQILSLRYQRSGLRRLFDAKGRSKADAASGTDIHEK